MPNMRNERIVADPMSPWNPPQVGGAADLPIPTDPRSALSEQALALASHNAFPVVAKKKAGRDNLVPVAGAAIAVVLGLATFASMSGQRGDKPAPGSAQQALQPLDRQRPSPPAVPSLSGPPMSQPMADAPVAMNPMPMGAPAGMAHMPGHASIPGTARGGEPIMVFDSGSAPSPLRAARPESTEGVNGAPALLGGSSSVQGNTISEASSVRSTRLSDPANTIAQGTLIPAVLETAIQSDLSGYARAVVSQDIRSFDGSQILVPRSSRLIGEYKGNLAAGQKRIYLMWTRLIRPDGVSIALASPAVDAAGQSGIGGRVNDHFFQRLSSGVLMSLVGGLSTLGSGGATVVVSGGQSAASLATQGSGQRAPTISVRQGEPIRVFTARDLIFASTDGAKG
jgi:type IV secretion system protein VirB10